MVAGDASREQLADLRVSNRPRGLFEDGFLVVGQVDGDVEAEVFGGHLYALPSGAEYQDGTAFGVFEHDRVEFVVEHDVEFEGGRDLGVERVAEDDFDELDRADVLRESGESISANE